jgi:hypothetical protein
MARTKRWTWKNLGSGFAEVRITSWKYFGDFVYQEMLDYDSYAWRGHRCDDWKLESTLDRLVRVVAAFFAFIDIEEPQTTQRAVFALHRPTVESRAKLIAKEENAKRREQLLQAEKEGKRLGILQRASLEATAAPEVQFIRPLSDENQRLVNQGGLFTRTPSGKTLEQWVQENHDPDDKGFTLIKVYVPNRDRDGCLRNLNRMNINQLSLFPDMYGASKFCNLFSEIDKY